MLSGRAGNHGVEALQGVQEVDQPGREPVNTERLCDPPALDPVGAAENAQELLPRQVRERRRETIIEAALRGHEAVEELPSSGRDAAVLVADRASTIASSTSQTWSTRSRFTAPRRRASSSSASRSNNRAKTGVSVMQA